MDQLPPFNIADYIYLALIALGAIQGLVRGLAKELARMVSMVIATIAGIVGFGRVGDWITANTRLEGAEGYLLALVATFALALVLMLILSALLEHIVELSFKGLWERLGGMLAGIVRMGSLMLVLMLAILLVQHPFFLKVMVEESIIGRPVYSQVLKYYERFSEEHPEWPRVPEGAEQPLEESHSAPEVWDAEVNQPE